MDGTKRNQKVEEGMEGRGRVGGVGGEEGGWRGGEGMEGRGREGRG